MTRQPVAGPGEPEVNVHDTVGGEPFFTELVERFYAGVADDAVLRPLYPTDLTAPKRHLALFLVQYWGGPGTYSEERGHPRLRMRHAPFRIGQTQRDAWLHHMAAALRSLATERGVDPVVEARMLAYFTNAADFMVNTR